MVLILLGFFILAGCSSSFLTRSGGDTNVQIEEEFSEMVQVEAMVEPTPEPKPETPPTPEKKSPAKADSVKSKEPSQVEKTEPKEKKPSVTDKKSVETAKQKAPAKKNGIEKAPKKKKSVSQKQVKKEPKKIAKPKPDKSNDSKNAAGKSKLNDSQEGDKKGSPEAEGTSEPAAEKHIPELENGFQMTRRRPVVDPFWPGEELKYKVTYFGVAAGYLKLSTHDYVKVNGRKHYNFSIELKSSDLFSMFYKVKDKVSTFVDFEEWVPTTFRMDIKESGQLRDTRQFFDWEKNQATLWEKKYTEKKGEQNKKISWDILPYSQNVFSAAFYMRVFTHKMGEDYAFRVADDGKNILFKGKVIREERLETDAGTFDTVVIKPEVEIEGVLAPAGDVYFWLTKDERRYIVKIESKVKIGTIKAFVEKIRPGKDPRLSDPQ